MADKHIMDTSQRANYDKILRTKGKAAAEQYKAGLISSGTAAGPGAKKQTPISDSLSSGMNKSLQGELDAGRAEATQNAITGNADVNGPTGNTTFTTDPNTGKTTQTTNLSQGMQGVLDGGTALTRMGQDLASQQMQGYKPFAMGQDTTADRARIEEEVFGRLTKNADKDYAKARADEEQILFDRGIPLNYEDPQYKAHMGELTSDYNDIRSNARAQATELGGQEYQRSANIGLASHQQGMSDIGTLQSQGTGLIMPNAPGFNGSTTDISNPTEVGLAMDQLKSTNKLSQQQLELQRQQLARRNSGSGASSATTTSPFNTGSAPGVP